MSGACRLSGLTEPRTGAGGRGGLSPIQSLGCCGSDPGSGAAEIRRLVRPAKTSSHETTTTPYSAPTFLLLSFT